jgi:hypothetical protein
MKTTFKLIGIIALAAIIGFSMAACDNGGNGDPDLTGTIVITPNTDVTVGTELTATYDGSETVTYQWRRGTANVGTNSNKFTPTEEGSYTVTVSATGFNSKTSAAVTVTDDGSGKLTITNIPSLAEINEIFEEWNEMYNLDPPFGPWAEMYVFAFSAMGECYYFSANSPTILIGGGATRGKGVRVTGSTVTLNAYTIDWEGDWETTGYVPFDGNYPFNNYDDYLLFIFSNTEDFGEWEGEYLWYYNTVDVVFTNGIGTISFNDLELD